MSAGVVFILVLMLVVMVLFVTEAVSFDLTALLIMGMLLASGVLTVKEALSGLSDRATVTIAAIFVLSGGLYRSGALEGVAGGLARLGRRSEWLAVASLMAVTVVCSAFFNNTAVVVILIPVLFKVSREARISPSKLLMPLSFAAMLGGVCTLVGTSTNVLVSSIAREHGQPAFSMFEFAPLGALFVALGLGYMLLVGLRLVPARRSWGDLAQQYEVSKFLTDIAVGPDSPFIGKSAGEAKLPSDLELLEVYRKGGRLAGWGRAGVLQEGDVLRVRGSAEEIGRLMQRQLVTIKPSSESFDVDFESATTALVEVVIAPEWTPVAQRVRELNFLHRFGAVVLAIRHGGVLRGRDLGRYRLSAGDSLLLWMEADRVAEVRRARGLLVVSQVSHPQQRRRKIPLALGIFGGAIAVAALGVAPIVVTAVVGALLMLLTHCLSSEEAYESIEWPIVFLLAGMLPLGIAMEKTGTARLLADGLLAVLGPMGPRAVLAGLFLVTMLLTNLITHPAAAAMLAPIALQAAAELQVSPRPLLMAVTYAASLSFLTPVGYQTNTLVYSAGNFRFSDFPRVGAPLSLLLWGGAVLAIPMLWPF